MYVSLFDWHFSSPFKIHIPKFITISNLQLPENAITLTVQLNISRNPIYLFSYFVRHICNCQLFKLPVGNEDRIGMTEWLVRILSQMYGIEILLGPNEYIVW